MSPPGALPVRDEIRSELSNGAHVNEPQTSSQHTSYQFASIANYNDLA